DRNRSHWSTSKTPSYTKSVSWQHHRIVVNVVIWDGEGHIFDDFKVVKIDGIPCGIGWIYEEGAFTEPESNA
ncbi:hypothetical protein OSK54_24290, partial [Escherichia coli]|nr:hypothetical protein [Escherichia coli]